VRAMKLGLTGLYYHVEVTLECQTSDIVGLVSVRVWPFCADHAA
jgi:predicted RNA-binding protein with PUA-like domain